MKTRLILLALFSLCYICGCNVIINPLTDMVVRDSDENVLMNNTGKYDFGNILINTTETVKFTIENLSLKELKLAGTPIVEISGNDSGFFQVVSEPDAQLANNKKTTFEISFNPTSLKYYKASVSITNNFENLNPYTFTISGVGVTPKIRVKQKTIIIPTSTGVFDFENVVTGETGPEITFTIENYGTSVLQLTSSPKIKLTGNDSSLFILKNQGIASEIEPNKTTSFTISFRPLATGSKFADITIENNDPNNNPYKFTITGTGITTPDINIQDIYSKNILDGSGIFDFGSSSLQSTLTETFIIQNLGNGQLELTDSPKIKISGSGESAFSVAVQPPASIAPGYSSTFKIDFTPTESKFYSATVSITSTDADENPYTFTIKGEGLAPVMKVLDSDSNAIPFGSGVFEFDNTYINNGYEETFTIKNEGVGNLILNGSPVISISGDGASAYSITVLPDATINPSTDTTFKVQFNPTNFQLYTATISINNNDPGVDPYTFTIRGNGVLSPYIWTKRMGGSDADSCSSMTLDSSGNIYLAGGFNDSVNFGSDFGLSDVKTAYVNSDVFVTKINFNGTYAWTKQFGGSSGDWARSIATDSSGNIFVTGYFRDSVDFGKDFGVSDVKISNGQDLFILKINANGTYGWSKRIGGSGMEYGNSITCDSSGNIFVTGMFSRNGNNASVDFGADFGVSDVKTPVGNGDIYVTKINADGSYGFTKTFGSTHNDEGKSIKTDDTGNIFVTGLYVSQIDFGADFGVSDVKTGCGGDNAFIMKINSNGSYGWTKKICGGSDDRGYEIAIDHGGNIYVAGIFSYGSVNFKEDFGGTDTKTSKGYSDVFVTKILSNGRYSWTKTIGGPTEDFVNSITIDVHGDLYITGNFWGTLDFGADFHISDVRTSTGSSDIFITKITSNGSYRWTRLIGGSGSDDGNSIAADSFGFIYIAGEFGGATGGTTDFGADFGVSETKTSAGIEDAFITKIKVN